jgi:hypothetical protein
MHIRKELRNMRVQLCRFTRCHVFNNAVPPDL